MDDSNGLSWTLVIIVLVCFWPVGIFLLWRKLSADKKATMRSGKIITAIGWFLAICGGLAMLGMDEGFDTSTFIGVIVFLGGGVGLILLGKKMKRLAKKYKNYITIVVNQGETNIQNIANITGIPYETVKADLEIMIDKKFFSNAYIDLGKGCIVIEHRGSYVTATGISSVRVETKFVVVQCKNCSATNKVVSGSVGECEYCGSMISG